MRGEAGGADGQGSKYPAALGVRQVVAPSGWSQCLGPLPEDRPEGGRQEEGGPLGLQGESWAVGFLYPPL